MRLSLWLSLILAFSVGMGCALAIRFFYFEAAPVSVQTSEPTTKILVAKRTIPSGIEITADFVVFQEVPFSEVPTAALTSFSQVYRRQPAGSIPEGYPICEDLLLPNAAVTPQTPFVPTGSQIVTLDVVHIRQGNRVFSPKEPLSTVLSVGQCIDIRVVPIESQGKLTEKKNELLRIFGSQDIRSSGELIAENVPIHRVQRQIAADNTGSIRDSLELMLDQSEAARLATAARKGQIRIFARPDEKVPAQLAETNSAVTPSFGTADVSVPLPETRSLEQLEQSVSMDIPYVQEPFLPISPSPALVPAEQAQRTAPTPVESPPAPAVSMLPFMDAEENAPEKIAQNLDQQPDNPDISSKTEVFTREINDIRNDGVVAFDAVPFRSVVPETVPDVGEQASTAARLPLREDISEQEAPSLSDSPLLSELTIGTPRITNTIQFSPSGITVPMSPMKEYPQAMSWQAGATPVPSVMPSAMSVPIAVQGKVPEYSPFERRVYTVLPGDGFGRGTSEELQAPQRLLRSSDSGTQTK